MGAILSDFSKASIIPAMEENMNSLIYTLARWPRATVRNDEMIKWAITNVPFFLFNSIMDAHLTPESVDATVQSILTQAQSRNVPLLWWVGPSTQPADLATHLEQHGFVCEDQSPGMAIDLASLSEDLPAPEDFTVTLVNDAQTLKQWSDAMVIGFGMPDFTIEANYDFMRHMDGANVLAYLGYLRGKPVATSLLILAAGVAGIYCVSTIPEARRQGIGAALVRVPLQEARKRGYKIGVLQSSPMGFGVYRSLGFQEYCKIGQYIWSPEHAQSSS